MMHKGYLRVSVCVYIYIYMCVCVSMYTNISIHVYIHVRKVVSTNMSRLTYALREGGREREGVREGGPSDGRKRKVNWLGNVPDDGAKRQAMCNGFRRWGPTYRLKTLNP